MGHYFKVPKDFIKNVVFFERDTQIEVVVYCTEWCYAYVDINGRRYRELYNKREPLGMMNHVFVFDKQELETAGEFCILFTYYDENRFFKDKADIGLAIIKFDKSKLVSYDESVQSCDRVLTLKGKEKYEICEHAEYSIEHYVTAGGEPVVVYVFRCDPKYVEFCTGMPEDSCENKNNPKTVMEQAKYKLSKGTKIIAAFNADFFDRWNGNLLSGLCVKDGVIIANPDSERPFVGVKWDGTVIIDSLVAHVELLPELKHAVGGLQILVHNGEIGNVNADIPFGYMSHPRTMIGIANDGKVNVFVIDGRRPWHSNGATLYECAKLLKAHDIKTGLNLDGGGSSTFIVENANGELEMMNQAADEFKPTEDLIREVLNSILFAVK